MAVKNFISITVDDMNAFAFLKSLYSGQLITPNIDRLMAMGTTFENSFSQIAVCGASRTSVLSGLDPSLTGVHMNYDVWYDHVDPASTLPGRLHAAGFDTSIIGKVFHHDIPADLLDQVADYYFRPAGALFEESGIKDGRPSERTLQQQGDYISAEAAIQILNNVGSDPFALFLGIAKPHLGWVVPKEYFDLYPLDSIEIPFDLAGDLSDVPAFMRALVHAELANNIDNTGAIKKVLQSYFASISFADAMIGRVLDALEDNGQLADTAILLWTDHGYHLGDKDNWHKFTLWEEAARAPFVIALPGAVDDGNRVKQAVELVDIMPTILDLLGQTIPDGLSGRSLVPFIDNPAMLDDGYAVTTMYGSAAIRTNEYRYILYHDGSSELYNIVTDPNSTRNLTFDKSLAAVKAQLNTALRADLADDGWIWVNSGQRGVGTIGDDTFVVGEGAVQTAGGKGDDTYFITKSVAVVVEEDDGGIDTVHTYRSFVLPDHVENLQLTVRAKDMSLIGNNLDNLIVGNSFIRGLGGNDILRMFGGNGFIDGGEGNDRVEGNIGRDILYGGLGDDVIIGYEGGDHMEGGDGADTITGTPTVDIILAGSGHDIARGGAGNDFLNGNYGNDVLNGGAGDDLIVGGEQIDYLYGETGNDTIDGGHGDDRLVGNEGDDILLASSGADSLRGGTGRDTMTGGSGADTFVYDDGEASAVRATADRITDFNAAQGDRINLAAVDARFATATDDKFEFIGSAAFTRSAGELRFEVVNGVTFVEADLNGDGVADLVIQIDGVHNLLAKDFFL